MKGQYSQTRVADRSISIDSPQWVVVSVDWWVIAAVCSRCWSSPSVPSVAWISCSWTSLVVYYQRMPTADYRSVADFSSADGLVSLQCRSWWDEESGLTHCLDWGLCVFVWWSKREDLWSIGPCSGPVQEQWSTSSMNDRVNSRCDHPCRERFHLKVARIISRQRLN